ncbi:MAG: stage II sporulation protein E [Thermincola sp.]|jgi:stage II sporulation protein E|nr:stage II sporulation protein E [Thermincola sp.]MDT3702142.1 stage II sporulation protein E [Thermincola sp.]
MSEKADVYPYYRKGSRKNKARFTMPTFPKKTLLRLFQEAASWENVFLIIVSFFAGRAILAGGLVPFPAAILAAVMVIMPSMGIWVLAAGIGGLLTVVSGYTLGATAAYMVLLFILLGRTRGVVRQKWYGIPVLVTAVMTAVKIGVYAYFEPDLYNYVVSIFEAVLAGCAAFLLTKSLPALRKKGTLGSLKKEEMVSGAVLIVVFLTGLSELTITGIEIKNVVARALVLFAAYVGGGGFGAAMGTLVGMIPSITTAVAPGMVAVYSFSGLLAGVFRGFGRVGICVGFILGNILLSIYLNDYTKLITTFTETALAVILFIAVPAKKLFAARYVVKNSFFNLNARPGDERKVRELTAAKIREYSRVFRELSRAFGEVSCDIREFEESNLHRLFNGVSSKVCKGCSLHRICWEKEFYKTYRNIMDMLAHIEVNGRLTEEHISLDVQKRCTRLKELAITVNCLFETYKQAQLWQRKLTDGKDIVAGQLEGLCSMMQNLADEVKIDIRMREDIEIILRAELAKAGYNILNLGVVGDSDQGLEVTISCPSCGSGMECVNGINPLVSRILSQPLTVLNANYCTQKTGEPICEFKLLPSKAFKVELGFAGTAKDSSMISGDSYSTFDLKDGRFAIILSDGMGVGPKAAVESKATITLLEKLLETGFQKNLAVKTVNSILVLGSPEETFATVDLATIDMMTGTVDFIKIGSAPSFFRRGDQVGMVRANSLPIGILNNIEIDALQQSLGHNDILVMVSDGVLGSARNGGTDESWVLDALQNTITTDPQNLADLLLNKAILRSNGSVEDDITVIVARLVSVNNN